MKPSTRNYTNGEVTVVWKPDVCIHSRVCFSNLPQVFNPGQRPWVAIDSATTEIIVNQVKQCPSGALSYFMNSEAAPADVMPDIESELIVEPLANGPLLVYGNITVKDGQGEETRKSKVTAFCRCGLAKNKPYCDGSHVAGGFIG